jgi:hypothetical protein
LVHVRMYVNMTTTAVTRWRKDAPDVARRQVHHGSSAHGPTSTERLSDFR